MEQKELLFAKLQTNPEYQAFQEERKLDALAALLFCIFFFWAATFNLIQSVTRVGIVFMVISFVCLAVSIGLVFFVFSTKPVFATEGIIKEVKQVTHRIYSENWYLVSDDTNQEYWGTSPSFLFRNDSRNEKNHFVGEKVLCFSMGDEKWIISE